MAAAMPPHLAMNDFIAACRRPLRRSIRVNTLKIDVDAFVALAESWGWRLSPIPWCDAGFWLDGDDDDALRPGNTLGHLSGLFYIQ